MAVERRIRIQLNWSKAEKTPGNEKFTTSRHGVTCSTGSDTLAHREISAKRIHCVKHAGNSDPVPPQHRGRRYR